MSSKPFQLDPKARLSNDPMSYAPIRPPLAFLLPLALLCPLLSGCTGLSKAIAESEMVKARANALMAQAEQAERDLTEGASETGESPAGQASVSSATPAVGRNGTYTDATHSYRIDAAFSPGKLTVTEPNKTSVYLQRPNTRIYDFTNPVNGIAYSMAVGADDRSLHAFKPGTPDNVTVLNLVKEASREKAEAPPQKAGGVEKIEIRGEIHYGVRGVPGYRITGRYLCEGVGEPIVELKDDGTGLFQTHGMPAVRIRWWVQAYPNGMVKMNKGPGGQEHILILRYLEPQPVGEFDMVDLTIDYQRKQMAILKERFKPF